MTIQSPILTNFKLFNRLYQQGLVDIASTDLSPFYEPNPDHIPNNDDFATRITEIENSELVNPDIEPMSATEFESFWSTTNSQPPFIQRLTRMGMPREFVVPFITIDREVFTSLNAELNEIVSNLLSVRGRSSTSLEGLAANSNVTLVSRQSDHFLDDLEAPTGVEEDRTSALRLRVFKFYARDLLNIRVL